MITGRTDQPAQLALVLGAVMSGIVVATMLLGRLPAFVSIALFALAIVIFSIRDSVTATAIYLGYAAMEGMYKYISEFSQTVYVIKPVLVLTIVLGYYVSKSSRGTNWRKPPLFAAIVLFALWGVVEIWNPRGRGVIESTATLLVWYLIPLAFYFLCCNAVTSTQQVEKLCYVFIAVSSVVSAFAVFQFVAGQEWTMRHVPGYRNIPRIEWLATDRAGQVYSTSFRPASTTAMGGAGAFWSHLGATMAIGLSLLPNLNIRRRLGLIACLSVNLAGLFISGVRLYVIISGVAMLLILTLTACFPQGAMRSLKVLAVILTLSVGAFAAAQVASGGAFSKRYAETLANPVAKFQQERMRHVADVPDFLGRYPLGIGYQRGLGGGARRSDTSGEIIANRESQFNSIAADMGIPGLLFLGIIFLGVTAHGCRCLWQVSDHSLKILAATLLALIVGYNIGAWGGPTLQGADHFWLIVGILAALPMVQKREMDAAGASVGASLTAAIMETSAIQSAVRESR